MKGFIFSFLLSSFFIGANAQTIADEYYALGAALYDSGKYAYAADTLGKTFSLYRQLGDLEGEIRAMNLFGETLANLNQCDDAILTLENARILSEARFEKDHELVIQNDFFMAKALGGCARKFDEAMVYMKRSIDLKKTKYGEGLELARDYNFLGYMLDAKGRYDSALIFLDKALDLQKKDLPADHVDLSHTLFNLAKVYENKSEITRALTLQKEALKIRLTLLGKNHPSVSNSFHSTGSLYQKLGDADRALDFYERALKIRKENLGIDHPNVAASYYTTGTLYSSEFNVQQAIHYILEGNRILEKKYPSGTDILPTYYALLGKLYGKTNDKITATHYLTKSLQSGAKLLRKDHPYLAIIYNLNGEYYADQNDHLRAIKFFEKARVIYKIAYGERSIREAELLTRVGASLSRLSEHKKADAIYAEAIEILKAKLGEQNVKIATVYFERGESFDKREMFNEALQSFETALTSVVETSVSPKKNNEPVSASYLNKPLAIKILSAKASLLSKHFKITKKVEYLKDAFATHAIAIGLLEEIRLKYQLENVKREFQNQTLGIFHNAMDVAYELQSLTNDKQYIEAAFKICAASKAWILTDKVQADYAKSAGGVPIEILNDEADLKVKRSFHETSLLSSLQKKDSAAVRLHQHAIFDIDEKHGALLKKLERDFPSYYKLRYQKNLATLEGIQNKLSPTTAMVEYLLTDSAIFCLIVTQKKVTLTKQARSPSFHQLLSNLNRSMTDMAFVIDHRREADKLFYESSYNLFEILLKPVLTNSEIAKLIIIPDDVLSQLNFGTLITASQDAGVDFRKASFVLKKCVIRYAYASAFVMNESVKVKPSAHRFAGFAPVFPNDGDAGIVAVGHPMRDESLALPGAAKEVEWISDLMRGRSWLDEEATETNFKANAKDYDVLHLAMHGVLNSDHPLNSELLFCQKGDSLNDGFLNISEIYNLNLNASLVVLSACNSGIGAIQRGEGAISLGRAFSFAGSESVVISLWKVPDHVTHQIMRYFYEELLKGIPKDEALQAAQFRFLEESEDPTLRHPFFWSGFVLMGDASPISLPVEYINYIIGVALALAVVLLILKRKSIFPFHKG